MVNTSIIHRYCLEDIEFSVDPSHVYGHVKHRGGPMEYWSTRCWSASPPSMTPMSVTQRAPDAGESEKWIEVKTISGWWFGTWILWLSHHTGNFMEFCHHWRTHSIIFQRGWNHQPDIVPEDFLDSLSCFCSRNGCPKHFFHHFSVPVRWRLTSHYSNPLAAEASTSHVWTFDPVDPVWEMAGFIFANEKISSITTQYFFLNIC